jgi:hypothetical protein
MVVIARAMETSRLRRENTRLRRKDPVRPNDRRLPRASGR